MNVRALPEFLLHTSRIKFLLHISRKLIYLLYMITKSLAQTFAMAKKCREEHCEEKMKKMDEAFRSIVSKPFLSRKEQARRFELLFQRDVLGEKNTFEEKQKIDAELSELFEMSISRRNQEIEKHQDVINAVQCELDHCQDTLILELADRLGRSRQNCKKEKCKTIIEEMDEILDNARQNKMTINMLSKFKEKTDELYEILTDNWKETSKQKLAKTKTNTKSGQMKHLEKPSDRYRKLKKELFDTGLTHQKCREKFINSTIMNERYQAKKQEHRARRSNAKDKNQVIEMNYMRDQDLVEFEYEGGVYECIFEHEEVSRKFEELMDSAREYVHVLFDMNKKKAEENEVNGNDKEQGQTGEDIEKTIKRLEKIENDINGIKAEYKPELSNSKKARLFKAFRIIEFQIGRVTKDILFEIWR